MARLLCPPNLSGSIAHICAEVALKSKLLMCWLIAAARGGEIVMNLLFSFNGRIGRAKFWLGYLAMIILMMLYGVLVSLILPLIVPLDQLVVTDVDGHRTIDYTNPALLPAWIVYPVFFVVWTCMAIAVCAKRFHDRGKSG